MDEREEHWGDARIETHEKPGSELHTNGDIPDPEADV